jgi:GNAT superfamily N-acetyltransferase
MAISLQEYQLLDNPGWHALQTTHRQFAAGTDAIQRYPADVLRIAACARPSIANLHAIEPWVSPGEKVFIVGDIPPLPENWTNYINIDCTQMVCPKLKSIAVKEQVTIQLLKGDDHEEMIALINLVQPGFFFKNTYQLGDYFGIRKDGKLVAVAGERLKMTGLTEVSAVVTHPDYTGRGYAQQLVYHVSVKNFEEGNTPFLHLLTTNERAKKVYELVGFEERRVIPFCGLQRNY